MSVTSAQDSSPTAVAVTPPSAEGCDELADYIEQLRASDESLQQQWAESFPGDPYWNDMTEEGRQAFLFALSPEELKELARLYDVTAAQMQHITVPAVVLQHHQARIDRAKLVANMFRDAATIGVMTALLMYSVQSTSLLAIEQAHDQGAFSVCPAFQQVLDYYADDDEGTPEAW